MHNLFFYFQKFLVDISSVTREWLKFREIITGHFPSPLEVFSPIYYCFVSTRCHPLLSLVRLKVPLHVLSIVISRLASSLLVCPDRLFYSFLLSVLSSKERLHISLVLLGNPWKTYQYLSIRYATPLTSNKTNLTLRSDVIPKHFPVFLLMRGYTEQKQLILTKTGKGSSLEKKDIWECHQVGL